ncbi:SAM-dependent methyltransferase [Undibacterium squillarum]|uniref:SAM-dependent methyltransferase n=1 Tax=Undibacterium squillarum TaxID=1131567 RepID=UPI0035B04FD9
MSGVDTWLAGWVSPVPTTNQGTEELGFQRWFHFKEAFSPSFVLSVIKSQPIPPKSIFDPFSGSGTTALTSQFYGIAPTVIEVNPFLADLTEAKLSVIDAANLLHKKRAIIRTAKSLRTPELLEKYPMPPTFIEPGVKGRWLFDREVAIQIFSYRSAIEDLVDENIRRIATVVLGSILVEASNAVVNGKGRRYRRNWQSRELPDVDSLVDIAFSRILEDAPLTERKLAKKYTLLRGDARERLKDVDDGLDLALFSPPYPNSFDYTDVYNIELWMLGYLKDHNDNRVLRSQTLRSHVQVRRNFEFNLESPTLKEVYEKLTKQRDQLWDARIPEMVGAYFEDLIHIIDETGKRLTKSGRIELVVGDSQYKGIHLPVPKILEELLPERNLRVLAKQTVRSMRSSAQQGGKLNLPESRVTIGHHP